MARARKKGSRFLARAGMGALGVLMALALFEGWLRLRAETADVEHWDLFMLPVYSRIHERIFSVWTHTPKKAYLDPPYTAFKDAGFENPERLKAILPFSKLPAGQKLVGHDFLRDPKWARQHPYVAHINSLGYRDPERPRKKGPKTFRILCLGEYQTFGHAVNDDETFTSRLEKRLNQMGLGYRFEVWNVGIHASTAIMGYARLMLEALEHEPDLVFLEYGLVDGGAYDFYAPEDHVLRNTAEPPLIRDSAKEARTQLIYRLFGGFASKSFTAYQATVWLSRSDDQSGKPLLGNVMKATIDELKKRGIPVVILDQVAATFRREQYQEIAKKADVELWSVEDAFKLYPPKRRDLETFDASPDNFIVEFGRFGKRLEKMPWFPRRAYLSSFYQLSAKGYEALALGIADKVSARVRQGKFKRRE